MFLNRLLRSRSLATAPNRNSPSAAASGFWQPLVDAGVLRLASDTDPTSAEGALAYHAWYRAISLIAQKVAAVPKHLYRRTETAAGEGKERARGHGVYALVNDRANEEQTSFQFWLQMAGHVPSRGNAFAAIYTVGGKPVELIPMDPDRTYPVRKDGELWYVVYPFGSEPGAKGIRLRASEVLHFRGFGFDGLVGYPVWAKAAEEIGLARGQRKLEAARYKNSGRPAMLLQTDAKLDDKVKIRLREDWERMHVGLDNAGRTAILDNGLKAQSVSMTAEDLEQSGAAQMSITAISNYTGVPASKLGASGRNYASQEQEETAFVADGLDFYLNVFEDEAGAKLLTGAERAAGYEVKANREALLRPALKDKFEVIRIATGGKPVMTQNEGRRMIDLPPSEEENADKLLTPLNMGQGGQANSPSDNADPGPGRPEGSTARAPVVVPPAVAAPNPALTGARAVIEHAALKLTRRLSFHANRLSARPPDFLAWLDKVQADHAAVFRDELAPCAALAASIVPDVATRDGLAGFALEWIHGRYADLAGRTNAKSLPAAVAKEAMEQERFVPQTVAGRMLGSLADE